jgi:hypothetical protein
MGFSLNSFCVIVLLYIIRFSIGSPYFLINLYKMDILQETHETPKNTFLNHVFSSTSEGKAEFLNATQYGLMAVIPVVILNKTIQRFIPEAETDKSSLEILAEIFIQIVIMFCGIIIIHRVITYFPTYSGFKYESLTLTNVILAFLVIILSIQTKLGIKINILVDRLSDLWNGTTEEVRSNIKSNVRIAQPGAGTAHSPSRADFLDESSMQQGIFPPAPIATTKAPQQSIDTMLRGTALDDYGYSAGPVAANGLLGGAFGSSF